MQSTHAVKHKHQTHIGLLVAYNICHFGSTNLMNHCFTSCEYICSWFMITLNTLSLSLRCRLFNFASWCIACHKTKRTNIIYRIPIVRSPIRDCRSLYTRQSITRSISRAVIPRVMWSAFTLMTAMPCESVTSLQCLAAVGRRRWTNTGDNVISCSSGVEKDVCVWFYMWTCACVQASLPLIIVLLSCSACSIQR